MTKQEILKFLRKNKNFFIETYNVRSIGLFGSYSIGKENKDSDIDILVDMPSNFDDFYDLKYFLEKNLNCKVDLGLKKNLRKLIEKTVKDEIIYV